MRKEYAIKEGVKQYPGAHVSSSPMVTGMGPIPSLTFAME